MNGVSPARRPASDSETPDRPRHAARLRSRRPHGVAPEARGRSAATEKWRGQHCAEHARPAPPDGGAQSAPSPPASGHGELERLGGGEGIAQHPHATRSTTRQKRMRRTPMPTGRQHAIRAVAPASAHGELERLGGGEGTRGTRMPPGPPPGKSAGDEGQCPAGRRRAIRAAAPLPQLAANFSSLAASKSMMPPPTRLVV